MLSTLSLSLQSTVCCIHNIIALFWQLIHHLPAVSCCQLREPNRPNTRGIPAKLPGNMVFAYNTFLYKAPYVYTPSPSLSLSLSLYIIYTHIHIHCRSCAVKALRSVHRTAQGPKICWTRSGSPVPKTSSVSTKRTSATARR